MRALRSVLVVLLALYTLSAAAPLAMTIGNRLGGYRPGDHLMQALMDATSNLVLVTWAATVLLYVLSLVLLVSRNRRGLMALVLAWALDVAVLLMMQGRPEYKAYFSPGEQQVTWWLLAIVLMIALGFWRTDVDRRRSRATPRSPVALT